MGPQLLLYKEPKTVIQKSYEYDCLSGPERQESLLEFVGKFSCTDNIPKFSEGDIEDGSDIASSSDSESE